MTSLISERPSCGMAVGFATELARKLIAASQRYRQYINPAQ